MQSKSTNLRIIVVVSILIVSLIAIIFLSTTAVSAQGEVHRLKFYLHPDLVTELTTEELNGRLQLYAEDLNTIFAQTNRQFLFDPVTDIIITDTQPYTPVGGSLPTTGYEIWIHAQLSTLIVGGRPHTYGGYASFDGPSGAGVAAGLYWDAIYDRSTLVDGSRDMEEYWLQLDHATHEIEHVFGAGLTEYYSLARVDDTTGVPPIQNVNSLNTSDPYWKEHPNYFLDPLLQNIWNRANVGSPTSYADLMDTVHFTELSTTLINAPCRGGSCLHQTLPDLANTKIRVVDALTGEPINNAQVNAWNVRSVPPYTATLVTDATTNADGEVIFPWDTIPASGWFSNFNNMKLIKAVAANYQSAATHVSLFDAQERKMVYGLDEMVVSLYLWPNTVYAAPDPATCGSWTPCYSGSTSIQEALDAVPGGSRVVVLGDHTTSISLQSGNGGTNRAALDGRYGGTITWTGNTGNLFASGTGPLTIVGLTLQCQGDCTNSTTFGQTGGTLLAYANNIIGFNQGYTGSGSANLRHNWWGASADAASIGQNDAYDFRLGANVMDWDTLTLDEAKMRNLDGQGVGIIISHDRGETQAPFGAATSSDGNSQCSDYFDYFTVNGGGSWLVEIPIDNTPSGCIDVHTNGTIFGFAQTANGAPDTSCVAGACWQSFAQSTSLVRPNNVRLRLDASQLQGTPIVAANIEGNDPTAVSLSDLSTMPNSPRLAILLGIAVGLFLTGVALWLHLRYSALANSSSVQLFRFSTAKKPPIEENGNHIGSHRP